VLQTTVSDSQSSVLLIAGLSAAVASVVIIGIFILVVWIASRTASSAAAASGYLPLPCVSQSLLECTMDFVRHSPGEPVPEETFTQFVVTL